MFLRIVSISFILLLLAGCGGGGGGDTGSAGGDVATSTSTVFQTFPPSYFDGSYSKQYSFSGSDTNGSNYTATWLVKSGADTTFNAQAVKTMEEIISITNTTTSAVASVSSNEYYSTDINNLMYLGEFVAGLNLTHTAISLDIIPLTATIGDFGTVGSYSISDGTSRTVTWSLIDGFNGKAKLVTTQSHYNASSVLEITQVERRLINTDGSVISIEIILTYHYLSNLTVTLNGSPN